jgi:hypothetical protein
MARLSYRTTAVFWWNVPPTQTICANLLIKPERSGRRCGGAYSSGPALRRNLLKPVWWIGHAPIAMPSSMIGM